MKHLRLAVLCGAAWAALAACGTQKNITHAVGTCSLDSTCTTYTANKELNLAQQAAISVFVQANCGARQGTFVGNKGCDVARAVAYCSFGSVAVEGVEVREVAAFTSADTLNAEQAVCTSQAGVWTEGKPVF